MIIQRFNRLLWTVSVGISLLSARYLLVELNFHYPLLLFCAQLGMATCFAAATSVLQWMRQGNRQSEENKSPTRKRSVWGMLFSFGAICFSILSLLLLLQAVLHYHNLPTLVMLTTIAFWTEDVLLLLGSSLPRSRFEIIRVVALLLACVGILFAEYRLDFQGLITSILAMICAGTASALRRLSTMRYPGDMLCAGAEHQRLITVSYAFAGVWTFCFWPNERNTTLHPMRLTLLVVNATFTILAIAIGKSIIVLIDKSGQGCEEDNADTVCSRIDDVFTLLALTGIVGCYSTLTLRRSYTSWYQLVCFLIATGCTRCRTTFASTKIEDRQRGVYATLQPLELSQGSPIPLAKDSTMAASIENNLPHSRTRWKSAFDGKFRQIFSGAALILLWTAYTALNFSSQSKHTQIPTLDINYAPPLPGEVVISMYKEPIRNVRNLISNLRKIPETSGISVTIYLKDEDADAESIRLSTGATKVFKRPNVGREGETYLYHILSNWDSLAEHTIFLQADIHNPREFYTRFKNYYDPQRTGFLSLSWFGVCDCESCGDRFSWQDDMGLFPKIYSEVYKSTDCHSVLLSYKGQFVASAARIRGNNKTVYNDLWHAFVDETSWAHQEDFLQGRPDSMSAPDFGFSVERIWNLLFQCSNMDIAWKCPTLVSGWRLGGDASDCQCLDGDASRGQR